MSNCDVRKVVEACCLFPFPAEIRRSVAVDAEVGAVHVFARSGDRFEAIKFPLDVSGAHVVERLTAASEALTLGRYVVDMSAMGGD